MINGHVIILFSGESRFDPYVGSSILTALETTISKINRTNTLALMDVQGRSIDVGNTFGVDVYFVIDVSKSINKQKMELRNNFISALFPQVRFIKCIIIKHQKLL